MKIDQKTRDNLFVAIRAGMGLTVPALELADEEYDSLLKMASKQSILSIVYRGMKLMGVSQSVLKDYDQLRLKCEYRVVQHIDALKRICSALDNAGIPYIPLKGAVLRELYPERILRTCSDIDILVHEKNIEKAVFELEKNTGFMKRNRGYHDISMISSKVHLELHFSILEHSETVDWMLAKVWNYAQPTGSGFCYRLTDEYQLFHVVSHMSCHMRAGGLGIRPFLDLWLMRKNYVYDEEELHSMFRMCNLMTFYEKCCRLVDAWMNGKSTEDDLLLLEEYCIGGGVYGNTTDSVIAKMRKDRGFKYIWKRIFMKKEDLQIDYPKLKDAPVLLPYYQTRRWLRLMKKNKRKQIRRELEIVSTTSGSAINSFDELLNSLGL